MSGKVLGIIIALAAVAALIVVVAVSGDETEQETETPVTTPAAESTPTDGTGQETPSVNVTNNGFEPKSVTVKVGDAVTWQNDSDLTIDIASDPHPSHTILPDLRSNALEKGKAYTFTFTKAGEFGYHDHLNPSMTGTVVVQ